MCTGGELAVAERAGVPTERIGFHGNNKSAAELARAVELGVGRIIVDSFHEIERLARDRPGSSARSRRAVMVRVTAGVEAHTHEYIATAHEDQKFGFSISSGDALEAVRQIARGRRGWSCSACTRTSARRSSTPPGSRSPPAGCSPCTRRSREELGVRMPELDLGGGFGIAYTTQDDPADPRAARDRADQDRRPRSARPATCAVPRLSIEPGRAIVGPAMCTVYEVGTVKAVELDGRGRRCAPTSRSTAG